MKNTFDHIDTNKNGKINKDELQRLMNDLNMQASEGDIEMMMKAADTDGINIIYTPRAPD